MPEQATRGFVQQSKIGAELTPAMIAAFKADTPVAFSIDHPNYQAEVAMISPLVQETLASDFA